MVFWTVAALLTLAASLAVLLPLSRRERAIGAGQNHDLEVYRDQLAELDRDASRGLIASSDVAEAHAEIARRILKADKAPAAVSAKPFVSSRAVAFLAVIAVPLVSWGVYSALGSPDLPSQPLSARLLKDTGDSTVSELVARAEAHLAANPDDARGWDVLAPIYMRLGRAQEALMAYRNAIRLAGASAAREAGLGEAIAAVAGGVVTAESKAAFERALAIEPADLKARFYLAAALAQDGRVQAAVEAWNELTTGLPAESPWRDAVAGAIAEARSGVSSQEAGKKRSVPGPDQTQIEEAAAMSATDRTAMIEGMVASLDERLRQNPQDLEGWMRLVRSYVVLQRVGDAREALRRGVDALEGEDRGRLSDFAASVGVSMAE